MTVNKVSLASTEQTPQYIEDNFPLFNKFLEYYYKSQEKTGLGQNILNQFLNYLNIDNLDVRILGGETKVVDDVTATSDTIVLENVDRFLDRDGSILIDDEVIFYERAFQSPSIALSPGISYEEVKLKWIGLQNIAEQFNGTTRDFALLSQDSPVAPPSAAHLIVTVYGETLIPETDYTVEGNRIVFAVAPRERSIADDLVSTTIQYQNGFNDNPILSLDDISASFDEEKTRFAVTRNSVAYTPVVDEYIIAIYSGRLLTPKVDFAFDGNQITFTFTPSIGRKLSLFSIEAPVPSFGNGAVGFSRVNDNGEISNVTVSEVGSGYRFDYPPKISINSIDDDGIGASVKALIDGVQLSSLIDGGKGYSETNPPTVVVESPTREGGTPASIKATVTDGAVTDLEVLNSGSGYTFTPRVTFRQPGGAKVAPVQIQSGSIIGNISITDAGQGYTTPPTVYIDPPTGQNPINAVATTTLNADGTIASVEFVNRGQGYEVAPKIIIVNPTGAQIKNVLVDGDGRIVNIELLNGGSGYDDIPSVYIVDDRRDPLGNYIGGNGATAVASIFNGQITDISVTNFGSGYSPDILPKIVIQDPPQAKASVTVAQGGITGFEVISGGEGYEKCRIEGCARAAAGITGYDELGNAKFSGKTSAAAHESDSKVTCLDALFVKRLLDKFVDQYLPGIPELDYESIDVRTAIKNIKTFYSTKGTSYSVSYLFKLIYGEDVSISYPKDQLIKPSASTWSVNTILRATLVSGNPENIRDGLLQQFSDIADTRLQDASALVENYISINTSESQIYELVLSRETIQGNFIVPYKTKLAEPLDSDNLIITVDSTIGWPEKNGEFVIGDTEIVRYKEKSLNQFIECTRDTNELNQTTWDAATEVQSNFRVFVNRGTTEEVVLNIVGIVDAEETILSDNGAYYLPGDKLSVSKLGGTSEDPQLNTWLYNVKKLLEVENITFGGVNNQSATVTCSSPHGLLVGDQVTIYGANPIIYNGTFEVSSRDSTTVFQYILPAPALVNPQGNILISVNLNKGKSPNTAIDAAISPYTTNIQNSFFNDQHVYVASTGIPNYQIGPFSGSALLPGNQRKLNRIPFNTQTISIKDTATSGGIGTWVNGVSAWSYKSTEKETFGPVTAVSITDPGTNYDAASPPTITISSGGGSGARASVTVDGSITAINVDNGGSGYTSSPLVSVVGGGGEGASATAIITRGVVSKILVNNGGTGYTSQPEISIVGGGGLGASATAEVRGGIKSVNIIDGGSSYTSNPDVILTSGQGAVAQAIVNNGRIISVAIISGGVGYTTAPEVEIVGDGFGAVAKANIDIDGENAGKVTSIEILNRGIGYVQGTTNIVLTSVGSGAKFTSQVFEWNYNLQATTTLDESKGYIFEGLNNEYGGEYAHISNPQRLRFILGDNLNRNQAGELVEQETQLAHSPIIGWAFDGNPIYGPYGYTDPTDQSSTISRMRSSYALKDALVVDPVTNPTPVRVQGPLLADHPAGEYIEDYEFNFNSGDLDQYNGRFCKTPDFPTGRYCYFVTIDNTEAGNAVFPYIIGPEYNSTVDKWNLSTDATQENIPTGVIRFRDPYENVDIDVERAPNASSNALTTESGDVLLFDVEDENRDGIISQDEIDDPDQLFEESPLQLFDYFPKVKFDSKVDIEVETITRFENASVNNFVIENSGENYQVNDILTFDNTDTDGSGVSARVSKITGKNISSYTYQNIDNKNIGIIQTSTPHELILGDKIFVDYTPIMDNTNKEYVVRQYKGIEEIIVTQNGVGYNEDIPPTVVIDGDGEAAEITAVVSNVGAISQFNIINAGSGYTENPRLILSHPQVFKKSNYWVSILEGAGNDLIINDTFIATDKSLYVCGKMLDGSGNYIGFIAKVSDAGILQWYKTCEVNAPVGSDQYLEFNKILVDGNDIWIVGGNRPNTPLLDAYNPDIVLLKYEENLEGQDASLTIQRAYAGISGSTREDTVTCIKKFGESRYLLGGFTNTNSGNPYDGFLAIIDTAGVFVSKRKIAGLNTSEKLTDFFIIDEKIYFCMEVAENNTATDRDVVIGEAQFINNIIEINSMKKFAYSGFSVVNPVMALDEYNELYVVADSPLKSDATVQQGFFVAKFNTSLEAVWSKRYLTSSERMEIASGAEIDIFGDLNVAFTETATTGEITSASARINYKGEKVNVTSNKLKATGASENNIEGFDVECIATDNSGDSYLFGQTKWNRNDFILDFTSDFTDLTDHYNILPVGQTGAGLSFLNGYLKILGYQQGNNATWNNSYLQATNTDTRGKLSGDWTLEFMLFKDSTETNTLSQSYQTLVGIGGAQDADGGLWLGYDTATGYLQLAVANNAATIQSSTPVSSTVNSLYADNTWAFYAIQKSGNFFRVYINGIEVVSGNIPNTALNNKSLYIANQPGWGTGAADFTDDYQGQFFIDNLRLKNRATTITVPSDVTVLPTSGAFAINYTWQNTQWFTDYLKRYDYINYKAAGIKVDKTNLAGYTGDFTLRPNTQVNPVRTNIDFNISTLSPAVTTFQIGGSGIQSLDYSESTLIGVHNTEVLGYTQDILFSRTATIPSPGSQKVKASAIVKNRYYFKVANTSKIDNVQILTVNQSFAFTVGGKLILESPTGTFINSGYITSIDRENQKISVAVNNNSWSNDYNTGRLRTERFDEFDTFGIRGPVTADVNLLERYEFGIINNTTPGTFDIALSNFNSLTGGTNNLHQFAQFIETFDDSNFVIKVSEISGTSPYVPGSVINIAESNVSYNSDYNTIQITGLTGVTKIDLIATLEKILQVTNVSNSDEVYVITDVSHYMNVGDNFYTDGHQPQEVGGITYDEYNGSFIVDRVISSKEFTYKLPAVAVSLPLTAVSSVEFFSKSPTLKMYNGHQYLFDVGHSTMLGANLSFSKDSLNKLEYSFNIIERLGTPGVIEEGTSRPSIKFKIDKSIVTNISYYFDPSRTGADSPIDTNSYLNIGDTPYLGQFVITETSGGTITTGDDTMRFELASEPEGDGETQNTTYSTDSSKSVGSIADIRIVNKGGFYTKLPVVTGIESNRKIERVQINEPGTEYAVGTYNSVPISGDGEGGFVTIEVENTTDAEGNTILGQIVRATVSSPGKGYTTASIDIESIPGILGPGLAGSGGDLTVVIPPFGTGASIFAQADNVGTIKKLKNNNFGYDYTHDYTLRPEITFPLNAQLTNTSILQNIRVTDPGSGYTQAPAVVITGGGGQGAIAESTIQNGRLDQIIVKDPGSGYSSPPTVELKSSFNYVVNLDLGLLQFAFPHGIPNGAAVTLNVIDIGDGAVYPLASGAIGRLNGTTTYYAISGSAQSLEDDQLRLALTPQNAELGDPISFANTGTGRQQVLTSSFGGAAEANVVTSTFLEGEYVYQGPSLEQATATGYVSTNQGWLVGPRIVKIVDYDGNFQVGESITGVISKSSGVITDLKIAKGVLEIGPITRTTGQFIDDVGKPSEIIQKIQDSYYYQDFSYAVKSSVSINDWKNILLKNVHPASFKVFGELNVTEDARIPNKEIDFQITKSVELAQSAIVPNIQNFALVDPIYQDFNNTEVLFRQKRLTSSENILTSVVQKVDDVSNLFDGIRTAFPLTVDGNTVIADEKQLVITLNGVAQAPGRAFTVVGDSIVFNEPPQPPASVKYVSVTFNPIQTKDFTFSFTSGIFPLVGNEISGAVSGARATVVSVTGQTVRAFITEGAFDVANGELIQGSTTGFLANVSAITDVVNNGLFFYGETITNLTGDVAKVERINLDTGAETPIAQLRYQIGVSTTSFEVINDNGTLGPLPAGTFVVGENYQLGSEIFVVDAITDNNDSTTLDVTRSQLGTTQIAQPENTPIYGTQIQLNNSLLLSKTSGTYQSTPGLFDIQLNDYIVAAGSGVVAQITSTAPYQDPYTQEFINQINISEGSSFFGLLFNRITSTTFPNVVLDDISESQLNIVNFTDNTTAFNARFPSNEIVNNYLLRYDNGSGTFQEDEVIRNYTIDYGNSSGNFSNTEDIGVRKLTLTDKVGSGFFSIGQVLRSETTKAEIIGYNQSLNTIYLGKIGRTQPSGEDYHNATFVAGAELNTYNKKFGTACLALSKGTSPHTFVSGVADGITVTGGAEGPFTAATGTTYDPLTGLMVIEIGTHTLTTSDTIQIVADGVTFTCESDGDTNNYAYPRATDPQFGQAIAITAETDTTITVNVGAVPVDEYLTIPTSTEFGFGTDNFTIELWIKPNSVAAGSKTLVDFRSAATEVAPYLYLDGANLKYYVNGSNTITGATNLVADTWYHVAVCRDGSTTKMFLNGAQEGSDYSDGSNYGTTKPVRIGGDWNGATEFPGYIDELRISSSARYTTTFTAPTGIFQGDTDTVLLLHFDGAHKSTYVDDWSGAENWVNGHFFNNDAVLATKRSTDGSNSYHSTNTQRYHDAANLIRDNRDLMSLEIRDRTIANLPFVLDTTTESTALSAIDYTSYDDYGHSVDVGETVIVVGSPYDDDMGTQSGSVYVYNLDGEYQFKITASDGQQYDYFGWSVSVGNGKIVVGAYGEDTGAAMAGAVYVYDLDGTNEVKITPSDPESSGYFGYDVAIDDEDLIVIGSYRDNVTASDQGSVYCYQTDGTFIRKIVASNAGSNDNFGLSVAIGNDRIVVGAPYEDDRAGNAGAAYIYNLDGTNEVKIMPEAGINSSAYFGWDVAVGANKVVVGMWRSPSSGNAPYSGAAYIHDLDGTNQIKITASDGASSDYFGRSVAVGIDKVVVGAWSDDNDGANSGSIYVYDLDGTNQTILPAGSSRTGDDLGYSCAIGANRIIGGAPDSRVANSPNAGRAYFWKYNKVEAGYSYAPAMNAITDALIEDLNNGSNNHIWDHAATLVDRVNSPTAITNFQNEESLYITAIQTLNTFAQQVINNQFITIQGSHGLTQKTDAGITDSTTANLTTLTPTTGTYDPANGLLVLTVAGHGLTTSDFIAFAQESLGFTCTSDGNQAVQLYPRTTDPAFNAVLPITAVTTDTFTVDVGESNADSQFVHTFASAAADSVIVLDFSSADCADVKSTIDNLVSVVEDTFNNAFSGGTDHLASITKLSPAYEYAGGTVDAFLEIPVTLTSANSVDEKLYANKIDTDARYRFRDASNLINLNRQAIVDKAAADMIARYPDLALDMPRNAGGQSTDGTLRCKTDLSLILDGISQDIALGGNKNTITSAKFYLDTKFEIQHIRLQVWQSQFAHERLAFYAKQAITGDLDETNTDAVIIGDWGITDDAVVNFTPTGATYDPANGLLVLTIGTHDLALGRRITIADNSLTFTCSQNSNATNHTYPRSTDPASGAKLEIIAATATTITVNVGPSSPSDQYDHTFVSATTNAVSTAGQCQNVKDAIDTLVETLNDIIAPTTDDNRIAADRIYFNREYLAEEAVGLITDEFSFTLNNNPAVAYNFSGENTPQQLEADYEALAIAIIADLQTTGNNSTVEEVNKFINTKFEIVRVEDQLIQFVYGIDRLGYLIEFALNNYLLNPGATPQTNYYVPAHTAQQAYIDSESPSNIQQSIYRVRDLINIAKDMLAPAGENGRYAAQQLLFNKNYYLDEVEGVVNFQFGSGSWQYDNFLSEIIDDIVHDVVITDVSSANTTQARRIDLLREGVVSDIVFTGGTGYNDTPDVTIDPPAGGGLQAFAEAVLSTNPVLTGFNITNGGSGYTFTPDVTFGGAGFSPNAGGSTSIAGNSVTAIRFDGEVFDFDDVNQLSLDAGVGLVNDGSGTGSSGFRLGRQHLRFGAGTSSTRQARITQPFDTTDTDVCRVYVIAGNGSNGGETPDTNEDLALYYSLNGVTWTFYERLVYGGSNGASGINGQNQNRANFQSLNYVDIPLSGGIRGANVRLGIYQMASSSSSSFDHYGVPRIGLIDSQQQGWENVTIGFVDAPNESATTTAPTATTITGRLVTEVNIINPGSGYDPTNPPTVTFSGGNPVTPAAVTAVSVILDPSKFVVGETVISNNGATATVLADTGNAIFVGPIDGTTFAPNDTLTQGAITITIPANGVGTPFDWYTNAANVQSFKTARNITSLVEDESSSENLWTSPESYTSSDNWSSARLSINNNWSGVLSPVESENVIRLRPTTSSGQKYWLRDLNLTSFETFDATNVRWDSTNLTFDNGPTTEGDNQTYTSSIFMKAGELGRVRFQVYTQPTYNVAIFDIDLRDGTVENTITSGDGLTLLESGITPYGDGWYRVHLTVSIGFGFSNLRTLAYIKNNNGSLSYTGNNSDAMYIWGSKINQGPLDAYTASNGIILFSNAEYNIKKYTLDYVYDLFESALTGNLASPSAYSSSYAYYDATLAAGYTRDSILKLIRDNLDLFQNQLLNTVYYLDIDTISGISIPSKVYGDRSIPTPLGGGLFSADYLYGKQSDISAEVESLTTNEGTIVKIFQRLRVEGEITQGAGGVFQIGETIQKQGDASVVGVVYATHTDPNYEYVDIAMNAGAGAWALLDTMEGQTSGATAQIGNIDFRLQLIDTKGSFTPNVEFLAYTSGATADSVQQITNEAAVTSNAGGKLTLDTDTITGDFEKTAVVYPESSRAYVDIQQFAGTIDIEVGDRISSLGHDRFAISIVNNLNTFVVGKYIYKIVNGARDSQNYAIVTELDLDNNYIYATVIEGSITNGDEIGYYLEGQGFPEGRAQIVGKTSYAGAGGALIQNIETIGISKRLYLSDIVGSISGRDSIKSSNGFKASINEYVELKARVKRFFVGFDGTQTTFDLTIDNGNQYIPDTEGHILVFINGILQPPGAAGGYTTFSDKIQFTEAPTQGSSFNGFYIGKLRQLDDISFEFDSLRQTFNLKRDDIFYSLTLTEGVQSSTIRPENNIIVSLNGVLQEPGVGFEIVGSRIIFSEIPRVGSTFVAFSYVGSEADVDAAEVVPPIEAGDFITIQGETEDREVAVIESSNSLITFDYLGSVFGTGADAQVILNSGFISEVNVTSGGSGYTSRPNVRIDSISGFDANIKALVGVGSVVVGNGGTGYQNPEVAVETTVPDDWTAPDLSLYGEEAIDPEIL